MGFTTDENMVRVDIFKPSGKWYETIAMKWKGYHGEIHRAFEESLEEAIGDKFAGCTVVCLEPYHEHSHPLCRAWKPELADK